MFFHMSLVRKETYVHNGIAYEIAVYRAQEDGHIRGYVSAGGFSDQVLGMSGDITYDMKITGGLDPVAEAVDVLKTEINAGKVEAGSFSTQ